MGSIDKALPLAGFYPDSQNRCSDGAKIKTFSISSKHFWTFLLQIAFFSPILVHFTKLFVLLQRPHLHYDGVITTSGDAGFVATLKMYDAKDKKQYERFRGTA